MWYVGSEEGILCALSHKVLDVIYNENIHLHIECKEVSKLLGWEDPLEEEMVTHSSVLAWEIPWTEEPGGLPSMGSQELDMTE